MTGISGDDDMDAILDQALDDLENLETVDTAVDEEASSNVKPLSKDAKKKHGSFGKDSQGPNPPFPTNGNAKPREGDGGRGIQEPLDPKEFLKFLIEGDDEDLGEEDREAKLEEFMKNIQHKFQQEDEEVESSSPSKVGPTPGEDNDDDNDDVAATLASILEQMTTIDKDDDAFLGQQGGVFGAGDFNPDDIVDGMMEQLLSKDLMYEPMKQVADRYPAWLEANQDTLSEGDLERYRKQFKCFQELVHLYEADPSDMDSLMKMMQEVQEFGQPPQDIINAIAPGLELDDDGMPKMNSLEALGAGGGDGECALM